MRVARHRAEGQLRLDAFRLMARVALERRRAMTFASGLNQRHMLMQVIALCRHSLDRMAIQAARML